MGRSSVLSCYMAVISYRDIFFCVLFVTYMTRQRIFKIIFFFFSDIIIFLLNHVFSILWRSFSSSSTFLINSYTASSPLHVLVALLYLSSYKKKKTHLVSISASFRFLVCFSICFMLLTYWNCKTLKISINNEWSWQLLVIISRKIYVYLFFGSFTFCNPLTIRQTSLCSLSIFSDEK